MKKRIIMTIAGVCICGLSVGLFSYSACGLDPFQVLAHGLWHLTKLDFGTFYTLLNIALLVVIFFADRRKIGLGTVINLFGVGYMAEFSEWLLRSGNAEPGWPLRCLSLGVGIVIMCLSASMYFTADLGVSTYDAVALILSERKGWKYAGIRIATDIICVAVGWMLGGTAGAGTVVTAFFMGPLISFFNEKVSIPLRYGKKIFSHSDEVVK